MTPEIKAKLDAAATLLAEHMTDELPDDGVFEDMPKIDQARNLILEIIDADLPT